MLDHLRLVYKQDFGYGGYRQGTTTRVFADFIATINEVEAIVQTSHIATEPKGEAAA